MNEQHQRPGDIAIRATGSGAYIISTFEGEQIDSVDDRLEAMRRGCTAALRTGGTVWISAKESAGVFHEVICP